MATTRVDEDPADKILKERRPIPKLYLEAQQVKDTSHVTTAIERWLQHVQLAVCTWALSALTYFDKCVHEAYLTLQNWQKWTTKSAL